MLDPKDSQGTQDIKNNRIASIVCIIGFIGAHVICAVTSDAVFVQVKKLPLLAILPVLCLVALFFTVKNLLKGSEVTELSPIPYIALIITTFFSCFALFYCPLC
jgi:cytochrome bd-type quinol oxidase subunit 2